MDASSTPPNHPANPNQPSKIIQTSNYSHHLIKIREKEQVQLQLFNSSKKPSKILKPNPNRPIPRWPPPLATPRSACAAAVPRPLPRRTTRGFPGGRSARPRIGGQGVSSLGDHFMVNFMGKIL
jgi:hypothetical protein